MDHEKNHNLKSAQINKDNGVKITYDKEEIKKYLPHIIEEISNQKKSIKIDSIDYEIEENNNKKKPQKDSYNPEELTNPTTLDFIRRCSTNKEAIEILDYLLKRNEISQENYNLYKEKIEQEEGLNKLIKESGGFKRPGYYVKKFYYKDLKPNNKLKKETN